MNRFLIVILRSDAHLIINPCPPFSGLGMSTDAASLYPPGGGAFAAKCARLKIYTSRR